MHYILCKVSQILLFLLRTYRTDTFICFRFPINIFKWSVFLSLRAMICRQLIASEFSGSCYPLYQFVHEFPRPWFLHAGGADKGDGKSSASKIMIWKLCCLLCNDPETEFTVRKKPKNDIGFQVKGLFSRHQTRKNWNSRTCEIVTFLLRLVYSQSVTRFWLSLKN